ncbi:CDP-glucose 4,6-dehydratase [Fibrisoma montanum]|uniref:CDP-glucose 4,6-dehydratase n=1 Tax=Fibrisoma montanum TaxID=2305895 RepID=A0A418M885_9BACT|nr:CDP-glucose 4,6-dehydratase [Fibrisoma montanum]RIV22296.1 CDP-glucose 4,6-dehydratase [Fibrisoma montanum]
MSVTTLFQSAYKGKTVLVTGHTGFKGSWLAYWLHQLQANVVGYSLPAPTEPSHWQLLHLPISHYEGDISNVEQLKAVFNQHEPEVVFHMAAQPLVRYSYQHPLETIETNVLGTVKLLECVRQCPSIRAVIIITSDKCYENPEDGHPLRETDPMGGYDPYSMSKGAAELVTSSYRNSFFNVDHYGRTHQTLIASVRAGNVIGGGDWASDRLIPDLVRGSLSRQPVTIRNPEAVRPWQHVLEPLSGYLLVGQKLLQGDTNAATGWNFGPAVDDVLSVRNVVEQAIDCWNVISFNELSSVKNPHEAHLLRLDCTKAHRELDWYPVWDTNSAITRTIDWYRTFYETEKLLTDVDLASYIQEARARRLNWTT